MNGSMLKTLTESELKAAAQRHLDVIETLPITSIRAGAHIAEYEAICKELEIRRYGREM